MSIPKAYVEHVAVWVRDIHWHIRFFHDVCGMTLGGLQFISRPAFDGPEGRLAHLGVMCEDLEYVLATAARFEVTPLPQGRNWLRLPDGLAVEFIQASPAACVAQALAINPRS